MTDLLSVRDARKYTGKSESTIKRMLREIVSDPQHEDRGLIQPSHEELREKKKNGEPYHWKISKKLLDKRYPSNDSAHGTVHGTEQGRGESGLNGPSHSQFIELLQDQITSKDAQIKTLETQLDRKDEQIANWDKRTQEIHILMQTLQKRLHPQNEASVTFNAEPPTTTDANEGEPKKRRSFVQILKTPIFTRH